MPTERRKGRRYRVCFLIRLEREEEGVWHVVARDMSRTGVRFAACPTLSVGEHVTLGFDGAPLNDHNFKVTGTIVRAEKDAEDPASAWPDQVAVEFDDPEPALEAFLADAAELLERHYPSSQPPPPPPEGS